MEARQEFYETAKQRLLASGLVKHVGVWNQDTEYLEGDAAFPLPAAFIEFGELNWDIYTNKSMRSEADVKFHLVTGWDADGDDANAWTLSQGVCCLMAEMKEQSVGDNFAIMRPAVALSNHDHGNVMECIDSYTVRFYAEFRP